MPDQTETGNQRLDQSLIEEAQKLLQGMLARFPDLRTIVIVYDYHLDDSGSLPVGTWLPSRQLNIREVLSVSRQVDKMGLAIRNQHDSAVVARCKEIESKLAEAEQRITELTKSEKPTTQLAEDQRNGAEEGEEQTRI